MPTFFRFLTILVLAACALYGAVYALATHVGPVSRPMSVPVPLNLPPVEKKP